jgi:transcription-repair coupling factor (superfamily II helicase)
MESANIMDRLVCGDVGFGKTELAIRAAFKAIMSGVQVAVLVPTTILSMQHFETFQQRLSRFAVSMAVLNRFKSQKQIGQTRRDLESGKIDILIGTHRILSQDIVFSNLGFLIIDEEHRFGVADKEKIKKLRENIDVLTMSATPIPRTLEFSLMGVRELSLIKTPPKERLPIQTKIITWDNRLIADAILREKQRNGQIIFVCNDISRLTNIYNDLRELVPNIAIRYAHGQMKGAELEGILLDFYRHKFDLLISTTIIESGIDIPNANTLFVLDAQNFGLSQLYQLRGRVGRSHRRAYAYLIIPRRHSINPTAERRLKTLEHYTDLGSGYQIAMHDLEIRGGGNLFGMEQSGFINTVGYDFYLKLLSEEIDFLKDKKTNELNTAEINIGLFSYFPDSYIDNENLKLQLYRRLANISEKSELQSFKQHVRNRFGPFPVETDNLFTEKALMLAADAMNISKLIYKNGRVQIMFFANSDKKELQNLVFHFSEILSKKNITPHFTGKGDLSLSFRCSPMMLLPLLFELLEKPISGTNNDDNLRKKQ